MFYCRVCDTWHVTRGHCVAGGPAPHPDRQWHGRAGEWLDRETHHEENTRGAQPLRTWSGESTPQTCTSTVTTNTMFIGSQQEDWECVQQVQTHAAEERWHEQKGFNKHPCQVSVPHPRTVDFTLPTVQDWRAAGQQGDQVPHRRHHVLLRLRAHAQAAAHQGRRSQSLSLYPVYIHREIMMGEGNKQPLLCSLPLWVVELGLVAESCQHNSSTP